MKNISTEKNETVTREIVAVPGESGKAIVTGTETIAHDNEPVGGIRAVAQTTTVVASDIVEAGRALARDAKPEVPPTEEPGTSAATPGADAQVM